VLSHPKRPPRRTFRVGHKFLSVGPRTEKQKQVPVRLRSSDTDGRSSRGLPPIAGKSGDGWGTPFFAGLKEAHWVRAVPGPQMRGTGGTHSFVMGRGHEKQKQVPVRLRSSDTDGRSSRGLPPIAGKIGDGWGTPFFAGLKEAHWVRAVPGPQMRGTWGTHSFVMGRGFPPIVR